jgi:serine/threonine protein kinase
VLKRDVAIKVLPAQWSSNPDRLRRFEVEAQAAAALNHPNIVSIYHVGEGAPYIVTELLHGESLRDRLHRGAMTSMTELHRKAIALIDISGGALRGVRPAGSRGRTSF